MIRCSKTFFFIAIHTKLECDHVQSLLWLTESIINHRYCHYGFLISNKTILERERQNFLYLNLFLRNQPNFLEKNLALLLFWVLTSVVSINKIHHSTWQGHSRSLSDWSIFWLEQSKHGFQEIVPIFFSFSPWPNRLTWVNSIKTGS